VAGSSRQHRASGMLATLDDHRVESDRVGTVIIGCAAAVIEKDRKVLGRPSHCASQVPEHESTDTECTIVTLSSCQQHI
jgi:hypothetical protein